MRLAIVTVIVGGLLLGSLGARAGAAPSNPEVQAAYERYVKLWQAYAFETRPVLAEEMFYVWSEFAKFDQVEAYSDSLIRIALWQLDPASGAINRDVAVGIVSRRRTPETEAVLRRLIEEHDPFEAEAAETLLRWGEWDLAAPVLEKHGRYGALGRDPRGLPILYRGLATASNPVMKLTIAEFLAHRFGDDAHVLPAAREVLAVLPKDSTSTGPRIQDLEALQQCGVEKDTDLFLTVAMSDPDAGVRWWAFGAVVKSAREGSQRALSDLSKISRECPEMDMRERSATILSEILGQPRR